MDLLTGVYFIMPMESSIPLAKHLVFRGFGTIIFHMTFFPAKRTADWRRFRLPRKEISNRFQKLGKKFFHGI